MLTQCQIWITNKYLTYWKTSFASTVSLRNSHMQGNTTVLTVFWVGKNDSLFMEMTELFRSCCSFFSCVRAILCASFVNQTITIYSASWEISFSQLWKKAGIELDHHIFLVHCAFLHFDLPCMHNPSVQFLDCRTRPSQSLPPFLGAGAVHSLLRQWVHSVPQVDHLLHDVHLPSTAMREASMRSEQVIT